MQNEAPDAIADPGNELKPGCRVAVVSADRKTFFGYGVYLGDFHHPELAEEWARACEGHPTIPSPDRERMAAEIRAGTHPTIGRNPKIRLDDGREVWGCECWWGPEANFKRDGYAKKYGVHVQEEG